MRYSILRKLSKDVLTWCEGLLRHCAPRNDVLTFRVRHCEPDEGGRSNLWLFNKSQFCVRHCEKRSDEATLGYLLYSSKKSFPLSSVIIKAAMFTTLIFRIASIPRSSKSTSSTDLMFSAASIAAGPPTDPR